MSYIILKLLDPAKWLTIALGCKKADSMTSEKPDNLLHDIFISDSHSVQWSLYNRHIKNRLKLHHQN